MVDTAPTVVTAARQEFHFTYDHPDQSSLHQGDILERTDGINELLGNIHPHFKRDDYKYLCILTQGCDLVRRSGPCTARYINLAAVRTARLVIERELEELCNGSIPKQFKLIENRRREKIKQFLAKLYNNNADDYFYLSASPETGLSEDHCVFLKLSIPVKSELHYETLLRAKKIQLSEAFQHKLGYLIGKSFSRVGTCDWVPDKMSTQNFEKKISDCIARHEFIWMEDDQLKQVVRKMAAIPDEERTTENLLKTANEFEAQARRKRNKENFLAELVKVATELSIDPLVIKKLKNRVENNSLINSLLK